MIPEKMLLFLTAENLKSHIDYMNTVLARYSIYQKSIPALLGRTPAEICKMKLNKSEKNEILSLLSEYLSHKTYFNSFAENDRPCKQIRRYYSSEDDFCYRVFERARGEHSGFIYIIKDKRGTPNICHSSELPDAYISATPILALDLCEHAYFADYGFNKEEYLRRAVARLDLSKLFLPENT